MTQLHCWRVFIAHFLLSRFHNGFKKFLKSHFKVWSRISKDCTRCFPSFSYFDRKTNILQNYKNKKMCLQNNHGPIVGSTLPRKRKKNLCASKFRKKKKIKNLLVRKKKNIKNLLQLLVLPLSCESRISHDIGCQIAHFSNVFSID